MTQAERVEFLRKFYELTDGELNRHVKAREEVGEPLGFDQKTADKIVQYWRMRGGSSGREWATSSSRGPGAEPPESYSSRRELDQGCRQDNRSAFDGKPVASSGQSASHPQLAVSSILSGYAMLSCT